MLMQILSLIYKTVLDALFPLSRTESEVLSMTPEEASMKLPPAPGYEGLAVDLQNSRSVFAYKDERVAKMIWHIKYKKSVRAVQIGGYALWKTLVTTATGVRRAVLLDTPSSPAGDAAGSRPSLLESADSPSRPAKRPENSLPPPVVVVIPMPITERRRKERGYNQCELLVDEIGRLDVDRKCRIERNLLVRTHHAARQTLKGRKDRIESTQGIFAVSKDTTAEELELLKSFPVIVIDDVITTGSTMYEAVHTLKAAGFSDVWALSLAH
jgi:hypothetical protein